MTERTLVIINEPFLEMVLGKNTTLSYIAAALDLKQIVNIYNFSTKLEKTLTTIQINPDSNFSQALIKKFKEQNQNLKNLVLKALHEGNFTILQEFNNETVANLVKSDRNFEKELTQKSIQVQEITNVIQRLEPMKAPFPPQGSENLAQVLHQIKSTFPNLSFNCPIYYDNQNSPRLLIDKDTPQKIDEILTLQKREKIGTPTAEFMIGNSVIKEFREMSDEYLQLFPQKNHGKIVIKPKDSAQSLGVFSIEFCNNSQSYDLSSLKNATHKSLQNQQLYKIKLGLDAEDLQEITEILLYIESLKSKELELKQKENLKISEVSKAEQIKIAKQLYNHEILIQPFLEGVKFGDIRANIIKNSEQNFELFGITFRRSNRVNDDKFTTCLTSNGSSSFPISLLTDAEQKNLQKTIKNVLNILNDDNLSLKNLYKNTNEIGADFLLQGDGINVFLGEINHICPALAPLSEIMNSLTNSEFEYDFGLKSAKNFINTQINIRQLS